MGEAGGRLSAASLLASPSLPSSRPAPAPQLPRPAGPLSPPQSPALPLLLHLLLQAPSSRGTHRVLGAVVAAVGAAAERQAAPPHDVLPHVAQLLYPNRLDQEVDRAVGHPPQHHVRVAVGGHHCRGEGERGAGAGQGGRLAARLSAEDRTRGTSPESKGLISKGAAGRRRGAACVALQHSLMTGSSSSSPMCSSSRKPSMSARKQQRRQQSAGLSTHR